MQLIEGSVVLSDAWFIELRLVLLGGLLLAAAIIDARRRRIPNLLVLTGLCIAFAYHLIYPFEIGWRRALYGMALAFVVLLPFYLLRGMAAGDVKLMMMVGAFLGPQATFWAVVITFLVGGVLAVALLIGKRSWQQLRANRKDLLRPESSTTIKDVDTAGGVLLRRSVGHLPYGVAIAGGTLLSLVLMRSGLL